MRNNIERKKLLIVLTCGLFCLMPLFCSADTKTPFLTNYALLEDAVKDGKLYPLESLGENIDVVINDTVYGYAVKRFQTWFEVGDAEIWSAVGITPPSGVVSWHDWIDFADAVATYNQHNAKPIWLLAVQMQRFPRTCALMENQEILTQWEKMQSLICMTNEESERVLLTEQVLTLNQVGYRDYIVGFEYEGQVYRLGEIETRYAAVMKDADDADAQRTRLLANMRNTSFAATGILPVDLTYEAYCKAWNLSLPKPSELNFALWKKMEVETVQ